ncbi:hypothetical protein MUP00_01635 [Candidatus Bathyarchaeota archaeon]|nr:hypothetical protein [Candidatus Bathyarchaeota archaeon]
MRHSEIKKKIRIKSFVLRENDEGQNAFTTEELQNASEIPEKELEEEWMATQSIPRNRRELDTSITQLDVDEEDFMTLYFIFDLYDIPAKPIENGIEIDIRRRESEKGRYQYWDEPPDDNSEVGGKGE